MWPPVLVLSFAFMLPLQEPAGAEDAENPKVEPGPQEVVIVTAARQEQKVSDAVSMVTVVSARELEETPALVLDDVLRRVPGFSLFRRSSSLVAHPTTQGVSLRGIGPSGASRTLVLFEGVPLNDPFGGWVYWNRIPISALRQIEVARGASSQLYGSSALGGTIQLIPRPPERSTIEVRAQAGNRETYDLEFLSADRRGPWGFLISGRLFETAGFHLVREETRGAVDVPADSSFQNFFGRIFYGDFHAGINLYHERRGNGTPLQNNRSHIYMLDAAIERPRWSANVYAQSALLESTFSRILADRSAEFLTADQRFPSTGLGSSFSFQAARNLLVGTDWRFAKWESRDQHLAGVFAQQLVPLHSRVDLLLGGRIDLWQNEATRGDLNPRAGIIIRPSEWMNLRGSMYRGFRAPTLNELYRPFRVGNILTEANPALDQESLWGAETGADFYPSNRVFLRVNGFWNWLHDPVGNVTVSVTPGLILRRRENLDRVRIGGLELEARLQFDDRWSLDAAYLLSDSRLDFSGLKLPQVPNHQATLGISRRGVLNVLGQARWVSSQFEDDLNELPLGGYVVFDLSARRALGERIELFLAVENLLDRAYAAGRTPVEMLGTPRLIHGGLQLRFLR